MAAEPHNEKPPVAEGSDSSQTAIPGQNESSDPGKALESDSSSSNQPGDPLDVQEPGQDEETTPVARHASLASAPSRQPKYTEDGKRIITEEECAHLLGYAWPTSKKWMLLSSIFIVQVAMNFNTSVFPNAIAPIAEHFGVPEPTARIGQAIFLITYAFGCELWAGFSEEFGRWTVLQ